MRWLLAGCCGLALINISVAMLITQKPRFYGVKPRRNVGIYCLFSKKIPQATVQWYKADKYDSKHKTKIEAGEKFVFHSSNLTQNVLLFIHRLQINDAGVYFCKLNNTWGPGSAVQVAKPLDVTQALYRTKMKDALIILQGLVLALFIAASLLRKQHLLEKRDIVYEEPETDHIYEGLAIETCGGDLYEDLCVYAQPEDAEAQWE